MVSRLSFQIERIYNGVVVLLPEVDGVSLLKLVAKYEESNHYTPAGEYGGIAPEYFPFGNLSEYYLGVGDKQWPAKAEAWLLGCDCGEVGCWPLQVRITLSDGLVVWSEFTQPFRPEWNYNSFGPFEFERQQYDDAVTSIAERSQTC